MQRDYVVLLRGISNTSMEPFRRALEAMGLRDVVSFGATGNLLFNARGIDATRLEAQIGASLGTLALVRRHADMARIVSQNPFRERRGAAVFFLDRAPTVARKKSFESIEFESEQPVIRGRTIYFVHPTRKRGRRATFDFEVALGRSGTTRAARVVERILERMAEE